MQFVIIKYVGFQFKTVGCEEQYTVDAVHFMDYVYPDFPITLGDCFCVDFGPYAGRQHSLLHRLVLNAS